MHTVVEIVLRVGPLLLFGVLFIAFVYSLTQGGSAKGSGNGRRAS